MRTTMRTLDMMIRAFRDCLWKIDREKWPSLDDFPVGLQRDAKELVRQIVDINDEVLCAHTGWFGDMHIQAEAFLEICGQLESIEGFTETVLYEEYRKFAEMAQDLERYDQDIHTVGYNIVRSFQLLRYLYKEWGLGEV